MIQSKTGKPVRFEITKSTRSSLGRRIRDPEMVGLAFLWPGRTPGSPQLSTRQTARIARGLVMSLRLEPNACGTHAMRQPAQSGRSAPRGFTCYPLVDRKLGEPLTIFREAPESHRHHLFLSGGRSSWDDPAAAEKKLAYVCQTHHLLRDTEGYLAFR